jgi:hypothetical protein
MSDITNIYIHLTCHRITMSANKHFLVNPINVLIVVKICVVTIGVKDKSVFKTFTILTYNLLNVLAVTSNSNLFE